ncbi:hypothetical protein [Microbacterium hydrocarbonoxydans]|uniref:hypothetical protein n=1 Tax=Microbacterium hydrocarbonoxydans TaxID=273678 RepID=UPI002041BE1F|nr:hypothetical protein [Microbacterium hydrocarbonoxydans]
MNTMLSPADSIASIQDRFKAITQERIDLAEMRRQAFVQERDDWRASGNTCEIVSQWPKQRLGRKNLVHVWESYSPHYKDGVMRRHVHYSPSYEGEEGEQRWGVYSTRDGVWIFMGVYVVVMADDDDALIVRADKHYPPTAAQVSRAAARLRGLARREHMKVSIHDTTATLRSPMNDIVHEGTINSAFLWLCGIDIDIVADWVKSWDRKVTEVPA